MTRLNRRAVIHLGLGGMALAAMPARAADNPMPDALRKALERAPNTPVLGNPKGDVTLVEFFDYNCPYCRTSLPDLQRLIAADDGLRLVLREWPVFGEGSVFATRASLAAMAQGRYLPFHVALLGIDGKAEEASVMKAARKAGLDPDRLRADMQAPAVDEHIELSMQLAEHMGLMGTPTFIAGNEGMFGKQSRKSLEGLVTRARKALA